MSVSSQSAIASSRPASIVTSIIGATSIISDRPLFTVSKWPARLPLSTAEIYAGESGASVLVSYQL